jgi:hypothetical protein
MNIVTGARVEHGTSACVPSLRCVAVSNSGRWARHAGHVRARTLFLGQGQEALA